MKNIVLSGLALAALAGAPAMAADMPVKVKAPIIDTFSWTGCHVGSLIGAKWGHTRPTVGAGTVGAVVPVGTPYTDNFDYNGYMTGAELGCDYQAGAFVFGVEGDWAWANITGDGRDVLTGATAFRLQVEEKSLGTVRGRLGFLAWPNFLLYVTGGGAWARTSATTYIPASPIVTTFTDSQDRNGWTVGAGAEIAFKGPTLFNMGGWYSAKAEYLYTDLGTKTYQLAATPLYADYRLKQHSVRFGLNYHFDWGGQVVQARY